MAREYLYRAKRIDNGEWVYGYYMRQGDKHIIVDTAHGALGFGIQVEYDNLCEYTNWKDKNDTKIFEGDIIRYDYGLGVITWIKSCGAFMIVEENGLYLERFENIFGRSVEVIGNKFDNPELLEVQDEQAN